MFETLLRLISSKRPIDNDNAMKLIEKLVEKGLRYLKRPPKPLEDEIIKITKLNHSVHDIDDLNVFLNHSVNDINVFRLENELANNINDKNVFVNHFVNKITKLSIKMRI